MYLPSLGSGWIIAKFGDRPVIVAGTLLMAGCVAIAVYAGHGVVHYGWALGVLGLGWNLLFIAATTMLTKTYRPRRADPGADAERFPRVRRAGDRLAARGGRRDDHRLGAAQPRDAAAARGGAARDASRSGGGRPLRGLDAVEEAANLAGEGVGGLLEEARGVGRELEHRLGELRRRLLVAGDDEPAHGLGPGGREFIGDQCAASGSR